MPKFDVFYTVEAASISEVMGRFAYPEGEPRTDVVTAFSVNEVVDYK